MTTLISRFQKSDRGGVVSFPFVLQPRQTNDVIDELKPGVYYLEQGQDGAPWKGYYAAYKEAKYAIENYNGVWFTIAYDQRNKVHKATRVAPAEIGLVHHPASHLNIDDLRGQTIKHGVPNLKQPDPPPLALARAMAGPSNTRPLSATSNHSNHSDHSLHSNRSMHSDQADQGENTQDNTPRARPDLCNWPTQHGRQSPSQNPSHSGGGGGGGGDPFAALQAAEDECMRKLLQGMRGDRLEGVLPKVYTGDRTNMRHFILAFDHYMFLNHTATLIRDPMKRASLFLGLLEGKALAWANKISVWLRDIRDGRETLPFGYDVWQIVECEFRENFTNFADADKAYRELEKLKMTKGHLDEYISNFQDLVARAGMDLSAPNTMNMFAKGLQGSLAVNCIRHDNPENFPQWVQSVQQNHHTWLKIQSLKGPSVFQKPHTGTNPFTWRRNNGQHGCHRRSVSVYLSRYH